MVVDVGAGVVVGRLVVVVVVVETAGGRYVETTAGALVVFTTPRIGSLGCGSCSAGFG